MQGEKNEKIITSRGYLTVYKYKAKEYNISESKERRLIILNASDLQM